MSAYDALRERALSLFDDLSAYAGQVEADKTRVRLEAARKQLADGKLMVVVCGEYKRGKSSLLNALLEEPGLFPVDNYYATSLTTSVTYGSKEHITVRLADPEAPEGIEERDIERTELAAYVTESGNPDNTKRVQHVSIELPNPRLASGLMLIDTPGYGGMYATHTAATRAVLPDAHAVVFVIDKEPMKESEKQFLSEAVRAGGVGRDGDSLIFVLTKIDLLSDPAEILAITRAKLVSDTSLPEQRVTLVPVSSRAKLDYYVSRDEEDLRESNFAELERVLWSTLARRQARVLLSAALTDLDLSARALLEPVAAEDEALRARLKDDTAGLESALAARRARVSELAAGDPKWRDKLRDEVVALATKTQETATSGIDAVRKKLDEKYLDDGKLLNDPARLFDLLREDLVGELGTAKKELDAGAARLQRRFARNNAVESELPGIGELPDPPVPNLPELRKPSTKDLSRRVFKVFKSRHSGASTGFSVGAATGKIAFAIVVPIPGASSWVGMALGGALGGLAGSAFDLVTATRTVDRETKREDLLKALNPWFTEQRNSIKNAVQDSWRQFADAVTTEVDSRLAQALDGAQDALRRVERAIHCTTAEAQARQAELVAERVPIDQALTHITELAEAVGQLAHSRAGHDTQVRQP